MEDNRFASNLIENAGYTLLSLRATPGVTFPSDHVVNYWLSDLHQHDHSESERSRGVTPNVRLNVPGS